MTNEVITQDAREAHAKLSHRRLDTKLTLLKEQGLIRRGDALSFSKSQLEQLERGITRVLYSNPRDAFQMLPLNTGLDDGMSQWSYRLQEDLGRGRIVADGATDRPMVESNLTKHTAEVYEIGVGYTFTVGDQARSGAILEFPYVAEKARICAETVALEHNEYALVGGTGVSGGNTSVTGFLNNATVVSNKPTLSDADWTTVTGLAAYNTVRDMIIDVSAGSSNVHSCSDVVLTTFCYNLCAGTLLDTAGSSQTVLSALRQNFPNINFMGSNSGNARGTGGIDRNVAYERSADNAEYVAGPVYDESTPISSGFRWTVHARGRTAGTIVKRPLSMVYGDITVA